MARFEYRIFAAQPEPFEQVLTEHLDPAGEDAHHDVYLVDPWRLSVNLKVRDGQLQIKTLEAEQDGLQCWLPSGEHDFPLDADLSSRWFPSLPENEWARPAELYDAARAAGYGVYPVDKSRRRFQRDDLEGEVTRVTRLDATEVTLALEHRDAPCLSGWVQRLAFDLLPNASYVEWLHGH